MPFNPSSSVYLCNVPFDNSYKNQIYFHSPLAQESYFNNAVVKVFNDYYTVRKTLPDGALRSSIKVGMNIAAIRDLGVNYMFYTNSQHSNKKYFCFVTQIIYVDEGTTELVFETDVYQTWRFDVELLPSFVVREHSETDEIGDNIIPENFNIQDFVHSTNKGDFDLVGQYGYLIASTAPASTTDGPPRGTLRSGIYQGLYFYFIGWIDEDTPPSPNVINSLLDSIEENKGDSVQFIAVIPKFCLGTAIMNDDGFVQATSFAAQRDHNFTLENEDYYFDGFKPKNNKLFTSPYFSILVTDHNGTQANYNIEDFMDRDNIRFRMYGDISASPSITLIPVDYKQWGINNDNGISLSGFPQCSFNSDTFKLWLAKNEYSLKTGLASDVSKMIAGIAATGLLATATAGTGLLPAGALASSTIVNSITTSQVANAVGGGMMASGFQGILNTIGNVYSQSKEPNSMHAGSTKNNLLTAIGQNTLTIYIRKIKKHQAQIIDDFFTMYGYQTNRLKVPNVSKRNCFNYVQTIDVNIKGRIPNDDMRILKAMYNNGVTLWKPDAEFGKYDVINTPV